MKEMICNFLLILALNLFLYLGDALDNFGIAEKVIHFLSDNASNMMLAAKLLAEEIPNLGHSTCFAHSIQLILRNNL